MPRCEYKDVYDAYVINKTSQYVLWLWKKQQIQAKTKISLEKWEKKVLKPFKP